MTPAELRALKAADSDDSLLVRNTFALDQAGAQFRRMLEKAEPAFVVELYTHIYQANQHATEWDDEVITRFALYGICTVLLAFAESDREEAG